MKHVARWGLALLLALALVLGVCGVGDKAVAEMKTTATQGQPVRDSDKCVCGTTVPIHRALRGETSDLPVSMVMAEASSKQDERVQEKDAKKRATGATPAKGKEKRKSNSARNKKITVLQKEKEEKIVDMRRNINDAALRERLTEEINDQYDKRMAQLPVDPPQEEDEAPAKEIPWGSTRFAVYPENVIHDMVTGLDWTIGPDRDMNYEQAEHWVTSRRGRRWSMPTREELADLYQKGVDDNNMINPLFRSFGLGHGWFVWSEPRDSAAAWGFNFFTGEVACRNRGNLHRDRVLAVRGRSLGSQVTNLVTGAPRFTAYPDSVIYDAQTGLDWIVGPDQDTDYSQAEQWAASCKAAGGGWRMPTLQQIARLYHKGRGDHNVDPALKTSGRWVWAEPKDSLSAWGFDFSHPVDPAFITDGWLGDDQYWRLRDNASDGRVFGVRSRR